MVSPANYVHAGGHQGSNCRGASTSVSAAAAVAEWSCSGDFVKNSVSKAGGNDGGSEVRSTQPCIPPGSLNRVPASAAVRAGMSALPGGR